MKERKNNSFQEMLIESSLLEVPRNTYQRGLNPERVKRIMNDFPAVRTAIPGVPRTNTERA